MCFLSPLEWISKKITISLIECLVFMELLVLTEKLLVSLS